MTLYDDIENYSELYKSVSDECGFFEWLECLPDERRQQIENMSLCHDEKYGYYEIYDFLMMKNTYFKEYLSRNILLKAKDEIIEKRKTSCEIDIFRKNGVDMKLYISLFKEKYFCFNLRIDLDKDGVLYQRIFIYKNKTMESKKVGCRSTSAGPYYFLEKCTEISQETEEHIKYRKIYDEIVQTIKPFFPNQ